jgi:hypothetical protein
VRGTDPRGGHDEDIGQPGTTGIRRDPLRCRGVPRRLRGAAGPRPGLDRRWFVRRRQGRERGPDRARPGRTEAGPVGDDQRPAGRRHRVRRGLVLFRDAIVAATYNPAGPARNSGLDLLASRRNPTAFGVFKPPVAAGIGSGGLGYDLVPGQPDRSILAYRIASTHLGVMMPELGKRLVHEDGVALIREWIAAMAEPR